MIVRKILSSDTKLRELGGGPFVLASERDRRAGPMATGAFGHNPEFYLGRVGDDPRRVPAYAGEHVA
jgi:hypothetical protein